MNAEGSAQVRRKRGWRKWLSNGVILAAGTLIALPLLALVQRWLPGLWLPLGGDGRFTGLLVLLVLLAAVVVVLRWMRPVIHWVALCALAVVLLLGAIGGYGFRDLRDDYGLMLHSLRENTLRAPIANSDLKPFSGADEILPCIDYKDRDVRAFAVRAATTWFTDAPVGEDEFTLVQCFSIFKVINSAWIYVSDPLGAEYFAKASESIGLMAGDCDDHAILMAACIKAVGGEARLVRTTGHIYPEMRVGDAQAMERAAFLIRRVLFPDVAKHATLFYHVDANGDRWINMDYTRHYPGGEVMDEVIKGVLPV